MATIRELLNEHNELWPGAQRKSWKGPKADLEVLVAAVRRDVAEVNNGTKLTIQLIAEEALLEVVSRDDDGNRLGHPYEDILVRVLHFFPEAQTTPRCLAWYASKMRGAGMMVPYRPRARAGFQPGAERAKRQGQS